MQFLCVVECYFVIKPLYATLDEELLTTDLKIQELESR